MPGKMQSVITKVTLNNLATFGGVSFCPTFVNYLYGNNGVGKTTVSKAIGTPSCLTINEGKNIDDYKILVYNEDFIKANIQNYDNLPGVFTIDARNIELQNTINHKKEIVERISESNRCLSDGLTSIADELERATASFTDNVWIRTEYIRKQFPLALTGTRNNKAKFAERLLSVTDATSYDLESLKRNYNVAFSKNAQSYALFNIVENTSILDTLEGIELLGEPLISSSSTGFSTFLKEIQATDWVLQGHTHYSSTAGEKCPYCQQKLPLDFEKQLAACFDTAYTDQLSKLQLLLNSYKSAANTLWSTISHKNIPVPESIDTSIFEAKLQSIQLTIKSNLEAISSKIQSPSTAVTIISTEPLFRELNNIISTFNETIQNNNVIAASLPEQKKLCEDMAWSSLAAVVSELIEQHHADVLRTSRETKNLNNKIKQGEAEIKNIRHEISELNSELVNTSDTIAGINHLLTDAGFQGFSIRKKANTPNAYEIVRGDGTVAQGLSEGERNFIAFLYFYHLVRGGTSSEENIKDKIVVIDDPVSSMDSNTLFIVSSLVREMVSVCSNNVNYEGLTEPGCYIRQIFILTHNAYFHNHITTNMVRHFRYVSFFHITKNNNCSSIKHCVHREAPAFSQDVNYNPVQNSYAALWEEYHNLSSPVPLLNVIRRILEFYFVEMCGYEGTTLQQRILIENRDRFVSIREDGSEDNTKLQIATAFISYITANPDRNCNGLFFINDGGDIEQYRNTFKLIFNCMKQDQHYKMMTHEN